MLTSPKVSQRKRINFYGTTKDAAIDMSEGNPGAISVLVQMFNKNPDDALIAILDLDDMNIRGTQIWIGYKDYCGEDIDTFMKTVFNRDQKMIDKINEQGLKGNHEDRAVSHGASVDGNRFLL